MPHNSKAREISRSRLMSQSAAARLLGMHRQAVIARIASGEIEAELVDETPLPLRASVEAYAARMRNAGQSTEPLAAVG